MKKVIIFGLIFIFGFFILNFIYFKDEPKTYHAGYMYWSHPTVLRDKWDLVLTGTVTHIDVKKPLNDSISIEDGYRKAGTLKIHEIVYENENRGFPSETLTPLDDFTHDNLAISGGFDKLRLGDKVLLFLTWYEGAYAQTHIEGTQTRLGIKLRIFKDPIVLASKRFVTGNNGEIITKEDADLWKKYDAEGLAYKLEALKFFEEDK